MGLQMEVSLSALSTGRVLLPRNIICVLLLLRLASHINKAQTSVKRQRIILHSPFLFSEILITKGYDTRNSIIFQHFNTERKRLEG
jgi:hypothetical protein